MKTLRISLFSICALIVLGAFTYVLLDHYEVSKDFSIEFKSKDPSGSFKIMEGDIDFDEKDLASSNFDFKIQNYTNEISQLEDELKSCSPEKQKE